jgi:protocatechuate 3,4-dioxygenase beta subunit
MKPTLAQMVHYRGRHGLQTVRAAIVTATQAELDPRGVVTGQVPALDSPTHVHLWVFAPGASGFAESNVPQCTEAELQPGTWMWPPRV